MYDYTVKDISTGQVCAHSPQSLHNKQQYLHVVYSRLITFSYTS